MRIGIDAHAIGTRAGGNETYMRELLFALSDSDCPHDILALINRGVEPAEVAGIPTYALPRVPSILRTPLVLPWVARRRKLDLLHVQYILPPACPCPCVVSVHDIGWVRHPELFPPRMRRRLAMLVPTALHKAGRVFVLTEAMRREIAGTYDLDPGRMDVVAPSVDPLWFQVPKPESVDQVRAKYGLPGHFVLFVGALQPRKNLVRLAQAFVQLRDEGLPHSLVITGERTWLYGDMLAAIERLGLGKRLIFTGYVDRSKLPVLTRAADAFAYVSVYEGFGLPVLEALACGVPVLTSNDPAILEVAADAALTCNPLDVEAIASGLRTVLADEPLRERLRAQGPARARWFTREAMGTAAVAGYAAALEG